MEDGMDKLDRVYILHRELSSRRRPVTKARLAEAMGGCSVRTVHRTAKWMQDELHAPIDLPQKLARLHRLERVLVLELGNHQRKEILLIEHVLRGRVFSRCAGTRAAQQAGEAAIANGCHLSAPVPMS